MHKMGEAVQVADEQQVFLDEALKSCNTTDMLLPMSELREE